MTVIPARLISRLDFPVLLASFLEASRRMFQVLCLLLLFLPASWHAAWAQAPAPSAAAKAPAAPAAPAAAAAAAAAAAIPLADVAVQAENASTQVRRLQSRIRLMDAVDEASDELPMLAHDMAVRNLEMRQLLTRNTPLDTLRTLEEEWRDLENRSAAITRELTRNAAQLDRELGELDKMNAVWEATRDAAAAASAPAPITTRIREVLSEITAARKEALSWRTQVLALQSQSAEVAARAAQATSALAEAGERATARLFSRESAPLWSTNPLAAASRRFPVDEEAGFGEAGALTQYLAQYSRNVGLHAAVFAALAGMMYAIRSRVRRLSQEDANLKRTGRVFEMPVVSALLLSLLFATLLYPRAPRSFWILFGVLSAIPTLIFSRRVIEQHLYPVLYAVIGFYVADRLRALLAPLPVLWRWALLAETVLFLLALVWSLRASRRRSDAPPWVATPAWRVVRIGAWTGLAIFLIILLSNLTGYARLADMLAATALFSAFAATVAHALARVGESLVHALLCVPPLSLLRMVERHTPLLTSHISRILRWLAFLVWLSMTLRELGLLQPLFRIAREWWDATLPLGSLKPSVGEIITFFLALWLTFLLSRLLRFVLEEEIFPNLHLERGLPYAINRVVHYLVMLAGIVIALGAIGVDMTKFTILAGAFSVGIGFGLQNIVNNFISGLIVLFERPIKVGDTIEIDGQVGRVQRIGIRASVMQSTAGSEVIIPNGKLISDKVINWTLSSGRRQISVPVLLKPDVDATRARELVLQVAQRNKKVMQVPAPEVLFIRRAIDQIEFELRAWTDVLDAWLEVRSDLITEINEALLHNEIPGEAPQGAPAEGAPAVVTSAGPSPAPGA